MLRDSIFYLNPHLLTSSFVIFLTMGSLKPLLSSCVLLLDSSLVWPLGAPGSLSVPLCLLVPS